MYRIPLTGAVIVTASERAAIANDFAQAAIALDEAGQANMALLKDLFAADAKLREYAGLLVQQSDGAQQIMQINMLLSGALGRIREGEDPEEVITGLEAQLSEFGGGPGDADGA